MKEGGNKMEEGKVIVMRKWLKLDKEGKGIAITGKVSCIFVFHYVSCLYRRCYSDTKWSK